MSAVRFACRGLAAAALMGLAAAPASAELFIAVGPLAIGAGHSPAHLHGPAGYYGYGYGPAYGYGWGPGYGSNLGSCNCEGGAAAVYGGGGAAGVGYTGLRDPYPAAYPAPFVPHPSPGYGYYNPGAYWNYAAPAHP